ncbi:MAG: hypothetical protein ACE5I0_11255, partial [Candidatus Binatia bacterium]
GSHSEALVSTVVSTPRGEQSFGGSSLRIYPWTYVHGLLRRRIKILGTFFCPPLSNRTETKRAAY